MRLRSLVVAAVAALGAVVPMEAASAAGSCSVIAPVKVVVDQSYREVPLRFGSNCVASDTTFAVWDIVHPSEGYQGGVIFDGGTSESWDFYDWKPLGRYTVRPEYAHDSNYGDVAQNTAYVTVKRGSRLTATTARSGGRLTFSAYARTWSPDADGWYKRAYAKVSLVYRAPGSSSWTWVKAATTNSTGKVTLSVVPKYGSYRLAIKETATVGESCSSAVRGK